VVEAPKLSEKTLEKRFQCEYCGETFRTRQGLSGHIQFKHATGYKEASKTQEVDMKFILSKSKHVSSWKATNLLSQQTNEAISKLVFNWYHVSNFFKALDLELTEQDFKTYLLVGLGKLFI
jgi:hypothetical protein